MIEELKAYLKITWNEDGRLMDILARGKAYLDNMTGVKIDYESDLDAKGLLFDYCRYSHNNAVEYFAQNFERELLRLRVRKAVGE